jgi:hypothetical protein
MDSQDGLDQPIHPFMVVFNFTKKKENIISRQHLKLENYISNQPIQCSIMSLNLLTHNVVNANYAIMIIQSFTNIGY